MAEPHCWHTHPLGYPVTAQVQMATGIAFVLPNSLSISSTLRIYAASSGPRPKRKIWTPCLAQRTMGILQQNSGIKQGQAVRHLKGIPPGIFPVFTFLCFYWERSI